MEEAALPNKSGTFSMGIAANKKKKHKNTEETYKHIQQEYFENFKGHGVTTGLIV